VLALTLLALWDALVSVKDGSKNYRKRHQLAKVAESQDQLWHSLSGMPVLTRSMEHGVSLVIAAWAIKLLGLALDMWKSDKKS